MVRMRLQNGMESIKELADESVTIEQAFAVGKRGTKEYYTKVDNGHPSASMRSL